MNAEITFRPLDAWNLAEVGAIARAHEEAPRNWEKDHRVDPEKVAQRIDYFQKESGKPTHLSLVALAETDQPVGFHWVDLEDRPVGRVAHIKSLWVHDEYQGHGIARELKTRAETWARENGAKAMVTSVHSRNKKMVEFNLRSGYEPEWLGMAKFL